MKNFFLQIILFFNNFILLIKMEKNLPTLLLNLDINKTLIFQDSGKNQSMEAGIRKTIAQEIWGTVDQLTNKWILNDETVSITPPINTKNKLISYFGYLKNIYKMKTEEEIPDKIERFKYNTEMVNKTEKETDLLFNEGHPGVKFKNKFEQILNSVKVPKNIMEDINNSKYPDFYKNLYKSGYIFIFNSLFRSMIELQKQKRKFKIIFRTFGSDFFEVTQDFNYFCEGKHPIFNGNSENYPKNYFDGTHNSKDYRVTSENIGTFHRFGSDINDIDNIFLVLGKLEKKNFANSLELLEYYKNEKNIKVLEGGKKIFEFFNNKLKDDNYNSMVLSDNYNAWFMNDKKKEFGKSMFIDPDDKETHMIFFDDNVSYKPTSIVDCRNIKTGKTMEYEDIINKFIVKVDPINAAGDDYYYVEKIHEAEKLRNENNK